MKCQKCGQKYTTRRTFDSDNQTIRDKQCNCGTFRSIERLESDISKEYEVWVTRLQGYDKMKSVLRQLSFVLDQVKNG